MKLNKVASYRAPDEKFCKSFNSAMIATGLDISSLSVLAIEKGLTEAVLETIKIRQAEAELWRRKP